MLHKKGLLRTEGRGLGGRRQNMRMPLLSRMFDTQMFVTENFSIEEFDLFMSVELFEELRCMLIVEPKSHVRFSCLQGKYIF